MQREIKFRCWFDNHMYKVVDIDFSYKRINLFAADIIGFKDGVLMQYTGLKDKNAKEIYEGDIVFIKGETELLDIKGKVEYSETFAQYIITNTGSIVDEAEPLGDYDEMTVIGNVWENSDLLKGE